MSIRKKIGRELRLLKRRGKGLVSPHAIIEFARDPKTALHSQFEWDDTLAAEQHRLSQARYLMRVYVTVVDAVTSPVRVWASLPGDRHAEGGYRAMSDVLRDDQYRAKLLSMAVRDMDAFKRRYGALRELAGVFEAMNRAAREGLCQQLDAG